MAYDSNGRWQDEDAGVANRIAAITSGSSDFMRQARTAGMQTANRRGLGNSSMAVGAAQGAAIDRAAPIAGQEAQQINQRNLSEQGYREQRGIADLNFRNQTDLDAMRYAAAERESLARSITDLNSQRMSAFAATLNNDKIPAAARADAQRSINDQAADAYARLQQLYGVQVAPGPAPAPSVPGGGMPSANVNWGAYVQSNPDALANWNAIRNTSAGRQFNGDINAFGQFHYSADGARRDLAPFMPTPAPAPAAPIVPTGPAIMFGGGGERNGLGYAVIR